jgi:cytidylate kinase
VVTIAVSGPDNVGKSTQIRLLRRQAGMADAGPLDAYDARWARARKAGLADWWFAAAPVEEVVDVLACSYLARAAASAEESSAVRLVDRGMPMLEASVVATAAVRERLSYAAAVDRAAAVLSPYQPDLDMARSGEIGLLLLHANDLEDGVARALAREHQVNPRYGAYQRILQQHLYQLAAGGQFAHAVTVAGRPILAITREIAAWLSRNGLPAPSVALSTVRVLALGGLSESGKSTAGHYLALRHGYARLKIGYLLETAAARQGVDDVYALDAVGIAELLIDGLEKYCAAHHFQRWVSIESLHRDGVTGELAKLLGENLTVVYLEATAATRSARGAGGPADVAARDVIKRCRGAERIRECPGAVIIDNNGPRLALYRALDRLAADAAWPLAAPRRAGIDEMGLPGHLRGYLHQLLAGLTGGSTRLVTLLAVTGSGARGKYQHGWSDLDVLVLAETGSLPALRATLTRLADELEGVKLGFTIVSHAECAAGALTPRLLDTLAMISAGRLPVLWHAEGLRLPCPNAPADALASLSDGVAAAVEIRRQLIRPTLDVRALYKVSALLAKVALRAEGQDHSGDAEALTALAECAPSSFPSPALIEQARDDPAVLAVLAVAVLDWWLATISTAAPLSS